MIKVCFISHHFSTPEIFLKSIIRMTPNHSGVWKDMHAVTDPMKADFCAIFDGPNVRFPVERAIYFGQHPVGRTSFTRWENKPALLKLPLDKYLNPGEWWIDHDYDTLVKLQPPAKTKKMACIVTAHRYTEPHLETYRKRIEFLRVLCPKSDFDLFGRPKKNFDADEILKNYHKGELGIKNPKGTLGEHMTGKEMLIDYRYSLEFDVGPTYNYFSERFYDAMLLWTMPIYYGSDNVHKFLPENSFRYIDIYNTKDADKVVEIMNSDFREQNIGAIKEARELLLNKYQTWPYVYDVVTNIDKYKNGK